jgi:hypothetical protein
MAESPQEVTQLLQGVEVGATLHGPGTARPDATGHRAGERGLPAAGGREAGELAKPRSLLRRFSAIHAAHPGGAGARAAHAEARQRRAGRYIR